MPSRWPLAVAPSTPAASTLPPDPFEPHEPQRELSQPRTSTGVLEREQTVPEVAEPGDHERFSHYVRKEKILESAVSGAPVIALCGKVWVPGRDPQKFPVCPTCKAIYEDDSAGWLPDDE